jgi:3-ketosteroid 9alpha-monooxygenase subunit B
MNTQANTTISQTPDAPLADAKAGKKIRTISGVVHEVVQETYDTFTLRIKVADHDREYKTGQFISIDPHQFPELSEIIAFMEHKKGRKELVRAYSMASTPSEPYVAITTKPERYEPEESEYPPLLSPLLGSRALAGRSIHFLGYTGAYTVPDNVSEQTSEVLHLVAGSGIVPNYAILKDELLGKKNLGVKHIMINVNKTIDDVIYLKELEQLHREFPDRFKLFQMLTREEDPARHGDHFLKGRPTLDFVATKIHDPSSVLVYACGAAVTKWQKKHAKEHGIEPKPRFLESVSDIVHGLGVDRKRYRKEIYG